MSDKKIEKKPLVPRLRFPEFQNAGEWKVKALRDLATRTTKKNHDALQTRVLTNSAEFGVVDQRDFFDKDIANKDNLAGYYIVEKGDYVYNPRISTAAPVGPISKNSLGTGVMSPLYTVFRFTKDNNEFYSYYFKTSKWHAYMRQASSTGARHDRMSIATDVFMQLPIPVVSAQEQQKISDCLCSLDELIGSECKKLSSLNAHKKGLMQQIFPREGETTPRLRFPEFSDAEGWNNQELGDNCKIFQGYGFPESIQGNADGKYPFCKVSDVSRAVNKSSGILSCASNYISEEDLKAIKAKPIPIGCTVFAKVGEAIRLNRRAITSKLCIIDNNMTAIKSNKNCGVDYFIFLLLQTIDMNVFCGGTVPSINKKTIESINITVPQILEQQKIADCLSSLDELIAAQSRKIELLKRQKKGLMQQLFPEMDEVTA